MLEVLINFTPAEFEQKTLDFSGIFVYIKAIASFSEIYSLKFHPDLPRVRQLANRGSTVEELKAEIERGCCLTMILDDWMRVLFLACLFFLAEIVRFIFAKEITDYFGQFLSGRKKIPHLNWHFGRFIFITLILWAGQMNFFLALWLSMIITSFFYLISRICPTTRPQKEKEEAING